MLMQWLPITHNDLVIEIILVIQDITDAEIQAKRSNERARKNMVLTWILEDTPLTLSMKIKKSQETYDDLHAVLPLETGMESFAAVKNTVHTLKGNSRQLNLMEISELCHKVEDELATPRSFKVENLGKLVEILDIYFQIYEQFKNNRKDQQQDLLEKSYETFKNLQSSSSPGNTAAEGLSLDFWQLLEPIQNEAS